MQKNQWRRPQQRSNICWYTLYVTQLWPWKIESNQLHWLNYMWVEFRWDVSNYSAEIRLSLGETAVCDYHVIITQDFDRAQDWAQPSPWQWEGSINIRVWNSITSINPPAFPLWEAHELLMKAQGCKFKRISGVQRQGPDPWRRQRQVSCSTNLCGQPFGIGSPPTVHVCGVLRETHLVLASIWSALHAVTTATGT